MVENQHRQIKGYRDLTAEEIAAMNAVKSLGEQVGTQLDAVATLPGVDQRWVDLSRSLLQQGFMAANRAIARPTSFA